MAAVAAMAACNGERPVVPPPPPPPRSTSHYVSPDGRAAGNGSLTAPWDLPTALSGGSGRVQPGDTIWLRGGVYLGTYTSVVQGRADAPVVLRAYAGERAILDAGRTRQDSTRGDFFVVTGDYTILWGLEFMDSDPVRTVTSRPNLIVNDASHTRYINLIVHDGGIGFYTYSNRFDVEVAGCLLYNNGWSVGGEGGGHGLYVKSDVGPLVLRDNVLFDQFGYGIHAYTDAGDGALINIRLEHNVTFNNGLLSGSASGANILVGGFARADAIAATGNLTYFSPGVDAMNVRLGWSRSPVMNGSLAFQDNYLVGGGVVLEVNRWQQAVVATNTLAGVQPSEVVRLGDSTTAGYAWTGDQYYRDPADTAWTYHNATYSFSGWRAATGLGGSDQATAATPTVPRVFVYPNPYEAGRANVIIFNWGRLPTVDVDLSGVLRVGEVFDVRSVLDYFGPAIASGSYGGGAVTIPIPTGSPPAPIGGSPAPPPPTAPDFAVLVVSRRGS